MSSMDVTFRYRCYPTEGQARAANHWMALCRRLYNHAVEEREDTHKKTGYWPTYDEQRDELLEYKERHQEFKKVHSQVLQNALQRVDAAYERFFQGGGYPRFKRWGECNSLTWPQVSERNVGKRSIVLPKFGRVRMVKHRPVRGKVKTATLILEASEEWYACIVAEQKDRFAELPTAVSSPVGVDSGLISYLYLSDGSSVENPRFVKRFEKKIKKAQNALSKKGFVEKTIVAGGQQKVARTPTNNRMRARRRFAAAWQNYSDVKDDWQWKRAHGLVDAHDFVAYEDLQLQNMVRNHSLARSLEDAAFGGFWKKAEWVAQKTGTRMQPVPARYTTQKCSRCHKKHFVALSERTFKCPFCGFVAPRDHNSSIVIKQHGLELAQVMVVSDDAGMDMPGKPAEAERLPVKQETSSSVGDEPKCPIGMEGTAALEAHGFSRGRMSQAGPEEAAPVRIRLPPPPS
jgi:putative transposase